MNPHKPKPTKPTQRMLLLSLTLSTLLLCPACKTRPRVDMVPVLLTHPQFQTVRSQSPEWGKLALDTINDLQRENERLKIK